MTWEPWEAPVKASQAPKPECNSNSLELKVLFLMEFYVCKIFSVLESDCSPSPDALKKTVKKEKGESVAGPTGLARSTVAEKWYNEELDAGHFDSEKMAAFKEVCLAVDARDNLYSAERSFKLHRFTEHYKKCINGQIHLSKTHVATAKTSILTSGAFKGFQKLSTKVSHLLKLSMSCPVPQPLPCPGITDADRPKVSTYLH
ncbi:hypothetical protein BDP27DRAFT_1425234 [Rhodocollybia butyracea]|uniref:Uncharacterized protein n=1 Tax=Rhodocollybia butyracea TaxID=206335 RepID=A0A9P5U3L3_9AGAR|nr:hypothetical protein BDP27DRAFT_1425234 [Rhodocollybia butyracea]